MVYKSICCSFSFLAKDFEPNNPFSSPENKAITMDRLLVPKRANRSAMAKTVAVPQALSLAPLAMESLLTSLPKPK